MYWCHAAYPSGLNGKLQVESVKYLLVSNIFSAVLTSEIDTNINSSGQMNSVFTLCLLPPTSVTALSCYSHHVGRTPHTRRTSYCTWIACAESTTWQVRRQVEPSASPHVEYELSQHCCHVFPEFKTKIGPHTLSLIKPARRILIIFAVMFSRWLSFLAEACWH